jgi:uncharacterized membrane protein (UPF0127 family)
MKGLRRLRALVVLLMLPPAVACAGGAGTIATPGQADAVDVTDVTDAFDAFVRANGFGGLGRATVRVGGAVVEVVVADSPATRERGLQGVDAVPEGAGMLFVFPDAPGPEGRSGFWMLETQVALDIAFAADGTVVGVATMQPCPAPPCPITHPGVEYDVALEVAAGQLERAGVGPGDRLTWEPADG